VIGYGQISRSLCELGLAFGMRVLVTDPYAKIADPRLTQMEFPKGAESDYVMPRARHRRAENLINAQAFARMSRPRSSFNIARES
jgi:D-3-phosphoglycerate dehydrogenase